MTEYVLARRAKHTCTKVYTDVELNLAMYMVVHGNCGNNLIIKTCECECVCVCVCVCESELAESGKPLNLDNPS